MTLITDMLEFQNKIISKGVLPPMLPVIMCLGEQDDHLNLIRQDPGLALALLRASAGSGLLDLRQIYHSLEQAEIKKLLDRARRHKPIPVDQSSGPDFYLFWRTCQHRAELARLLAPLAGLEEHVEGLFTVSLLQEAPLAILLLYLPARLRRTFPGFHWSLNTILKWSQDTISLDIRHFGSRLYKAWNLPYLLVQSQQLPFIHNHNPQLMLLDLAGQLIESFYAPDVDLDTDKLLKERRLAISAQDLSQALLASLESLPFAAVCPTSQFEVPEEFDEWSLTR